MQHTPSAEFHQPQGFLSLAKNVGIKDDTLDLAVIYSTVRARAAAMFTQNRFLGAPIIVGKKHIANGYVQALGWTKPYHVDADHIHLETVDRFLAASDFFTIDVADSIGGELLEIRQTIERVKWRERKQVDLPDFVDKRMWRRKGPLRGRDLGLGVGIRLLQLCKDLLRTVDH